MGGQRARREECLNGGEQKPVVGARHVHVATGAECAAFDFRAARRSIDAPFLATRLRAGAYLAAGPTSASHRSASGRRPGSGDCGRSPREKAARKCLCQGAKRGTIQL